MKINEKTSRAKVLGVLFFHSIFVAVITGLVGGIAGMGLAQESPIVGLAWIAIVLISSIVLTSKSKWFGIETIAKQGGLPYKILLTLFSLVIAIVIGVLIIASQIGSGIGRAL